MHVAPRPSTPNPPQSASVPQATRSPVVGSYSATLVGCWVGATVPGVGTTEGLLEGESVVGAWTGLDVMGAEDGWDEGSEDGLFDGTSVTGALVGLDVMGAEDGWDEGSPLGIFEGNELGSEDGLFDGTSVTGALVGASVIGNRVGAPVTGAGLGPEGHVVSVPHIASV